MPAVYIDLKGDKEIQQALLRMAESVSFEMLTALKNAAEETKDTMGENIPTRTGSLKSSLSIDFIDEGSKITAHIGPDDANFEGRAVGRATELGRKAGGGFPNWNDIANRYGVSLGVAYAIAKKIQADGSSGLFYAEKSVLTIQPMFMERGMQAVRRITSKF